MQDVDSATLPQCVIWRRLEERISSWLFFFLSRFTVWLQTRFSTLLKTLKEEREFLHFFQKKERKGFNRENKKIQFLNCLPQTLKRYISIFFKDSNPSLSVQFILTKKKKFYTKLKEIIMWLEKFGRLDWLWGRGTSTTTYLSIPCQREDNIR